MSKTESKIYKGSDSGLISLGPVTKKPMSPIRRAPVAKISSDEYSKAKEIAAEIKLHIPTSYKQIGDNRYDYELDEYTKLSIEATHLIWNKERGRIITKY